MLHGEVLDLNKYVSSDKEFIPDSELKLKKYYNLEVRTSLGVFATDATGRKGHREYHLVLLEDNSLMAVTVFSNDSDSAVLKEMSSEILNTGKTNYFVKCTGKLNQLTSFENDYENYIKDLKAKGILDDSVIVRHIVLNQPNGGRIHLWLLLGVLIISIILFIKNIIEASHRKSS